MPSVYTSSVTNVMQLTNESDAKFHVEANTSFSTNTTPNTSTIPPPHGLSPAASIIIVVVVILLFALLCGGIFYFYRRRRHSKSPPKPVAPTPAVPLVSPPVPRVRHIRPAVIPKNPRPAHPAALLVSPPVPRVHHIPPAVTPQNPRPALPPLQCLKPICREYLNRLNVNEAYFDSRYDQCFCKKCHDPSDINLKCGRWCKQQHNWVRFGLRLSQAHQKGQKIFKEWDTSYYGTSSNLLAPILHNRFLPLDGDKLADGSTFKSGHPDPTHYTTSPSLFHASRPEFTSASHFRASNGTNYTVQVVLQCKQKPGTYTVQGNSTKFHDTEWATVTRSTLMQYGLLVRLK